MNQEDEDLSNPGDHGTKKNLSMFHDYLFSKVGPKFKIQHRKPALKMRDDLNDDEFYGS